MAAARHCAHSNLPPPPPSPLLFHLPVLPRALYPAWATRAFDWYLDTYGDPLMAALPPWFKALVWSEVLLQLPFFFVAAAAFAKGDARIVRPAAAYGFSVATTLVPILAELAASPAITDEASRRTLLAFYTPYLVLPLAIGVWALRAAGSDPFSGKGGGGGKARGDRRAKRA